MKRKLNKPAVHVFRLSRCGSKMKLERQQSMKRLSPNFQDADVIVLAVALFKLAAVPWTKASLPHVFLCKPRFSFVEVGCSWLKLFSTVWDDTEHLLLMYGPQIQCKDLSCSHGHRVKDAERQTWTAMVPDPHLFFSYFCVFYWQLFCFSNMSRKSERWLFRGKYWHWGEGLIHGLLNNHILTWATLYWSVSVVFVTSFFFFFLTFAVKNSRFVFGQMDRSWLMLPREEINSAVDWGPCLSLGFIRCWCWQCERTTCTKKNEG